MKTSDAPVVDNFEAKYASDFDLNKTKYHITFCTSDYSLPAIVLSKNCFIRGANPQNIFLYR
jgi:hypothetical protein